jgi:hypothetical protein
VKWKNFLESATSNEPSDKVKQSLLAIYLKLLEPLIKALEYRKGQKIESLQKALAESAEKEAHDIEVNLYKLKRSIEIELKEPEYEELQKLLPGFNDEEKRQFEFNRDMMLNRINEIPAEIEREKEIIRKRYETVKPLLFPIAVSFYVPEKVQSVTIYDKICPQHVNTLNGLPLHSSFRCLFSNNGCRTVLNRTFPKYLLPLRNMEIRLAMLTKLKSMLCLFCKTFLISIMITFSKDNLFHKRFM